MTYNVRNIAIALVLAGIAAFLVIMYTGNVQKQAHNSQQTTTVLVATADIPAGYTFYRIAEMHYADEDAYGRYLAWFEEHPLAPDRGPAGRTDFRFYLVTESTEVSR